jgi:hypothetical protein
VVVGFSLAEQLITSFLLAFPECPVTSDDLFAGGDKVAMSLSWRGTHKGQFLRNREDLKQATIRRGPSADSFAWSAKLATQILHPTALSKRDCFKRSR